MGVYKLFKGFPLFFLVNFYVSLFSQAVRRFSFTRKLFDYQMMCVNLNTSATIEYKSRGRAYAKSESANRYRENYAYSMFCFLQIEFSRSIYSWSELYTDDYPPHINCRLTNLLIIRSNLLYISLLTSICAPCISSNLI